MRELGRGGMGIVFLARDLALDRLVAIKLLPPHLATGGDWRARFLQEARTAAGLSHPHIVPIHGIGISIGVGRAYRPIADRASTDERVVNVH